jgi:hypothetical protein
MSSILLSFVSQFVFLDVFLIVFGSFMSLGTMVETRMLFVALWSKVETLNTQTVEFNVM